MKYFSTICIAVFVFVFCTGFGLGGNKLTSSKKIRKGPIEVSAPYAKYSKYFGYVDSSVKPDGQYKSKDAYYLYVWVPAAADEIGISMVSPAKGKPKKKDFYHDKFKAGMKKDKKAFFDTYIVLDRMNVVDAKKIKNGGSVLATLQYDDDSRELPKNPSGRYYNSLLRHVSEVRSPTKAIVRGLYRISFTSFRGNVSGSYLATVGTNVPGILIADNLADLHALANK